MLKESVLQSIKIMVGVLLAVTTAKLLNMQFFTSVSTIVIVSMLSAKKQSIKLATTRMLAAIVSLALATVLFTLLGFSFEVFILYILIFTFLMHVFDMKVAIVLNVVLVMHIQSIGAITLPILLNEFGLMLLGISTALLVNSFTINIEDELLEYQDEVEMRINSIFKNMGNCIEMKCTVDAVESELEELDKTLKLAENRAKQYMNNYYIQNNVYYEEYFRMRRRQYYTIKRMPKYLTLKSLKVDDAKMLKEFTDNFVNNTKIFRSCQLQLEYLNEIKHHFTYVSALPKSHDMLQNRIGLHQYLYSLEDLVTLKMRFIDKYEKY